MKEVSSLEEVIYVSWEESEEGWGTRPKGCSLHLTMEDFEKFEREQWEFIWELARKYGKDPNQVPSSYLRPAGKPVKVYVGKELYSKLEKSSGGGIKLFESEEREEVNKGNLVYGEEKDGWVNLGAFSGRTF